MLSQDLKPDVDPDAQFHGPACGLVGALREARPVVGVRARLHGEQAELAAVAGEDALGRLARHPLEVVRRRSVGLLLQDDPLAFYAAAVLLAELAEQVGSRAGIDRGWARVEAQVRARRRASPRLAPGNPSSTAIATTTADNTASTPAVGLLLINALNGISSLICSGCPLRPGVLSEGKINGSCRRTPRVSFSDPHGVRSTSDAPGFLTTG